MTAYIDKSHPVVAYFLDFIAPICFTVFLSIMAVHFQVHLAPVSVLSLQLYKAARHLVEVFTFIIADWIDWRDRCCRV